MSVCVSVCVDREGERDVEMSSRVMGSAEGNLVITRGGGGVGGIL